MWGWEAGATSVEKKGTRAGQSLRGLQTTLDRVTAAPGLAVEATGGTGGRWAGFPLPGDQRH